LNKSLQPQPSNQPLIDENQEPITSQLFWTIWAIVAAFGTYFCMYGFRKPFTVASYSDTLLWGVSFKAILVSSQVMGYAVSKFIGIKVISEMTPRYRGLSLLLLIVVAEIALVLFAVTPRPWNAIWLFMNGLPLGMVFGLVLGFLEGRRMTEALTAGLCCSFILADGVMKSVGSWLLKQGVVEDWMPCVAGAIFFLPLLCFLGMLVRVPPPSQLDCRERHERTPLDGRTRRELFYRYAGGLTAVVLLYLMITILRSVRSDFQPELWRGLKVSSPPELFTQSEIPVALGVLCINGGFALIHDNRRAFFASLLLCGVGVLLLAVTLGLQALGQISPLAFMILLGLGLYVPYVAVHTSVFERFMAATRERGNIGFLMYVADSIGYIGYVGVMLAKNSLRIKGDFLDYFLQMCWVITGLSFLAVGVAWYYFTMRHPILPNNPSKV
jgi:hypothetical protein